MREPPVGAVWVGGGGCPEEAGQRRGFGEGKRGEGRGARGDGEEEAGRDAAATLEGLRWGGC